jgi:hypothetical protein
MDSALFRIVERPGFGSNALSDELYEKLSAYNPIRKHPALKESDGVWVRIDFQTTEDLADALSYQYLFLEEE